ncbi:shugoshin-1-like isoform X2 [Hordeum vulgare subsp. vulgare]|nr:shugoshin-1-like isoform X2 [Hordeum vulgare subsp. vulgare]
MGEKEELQSCRKEEEGIHRPRKLPNLPQSFRLPNPSPSILGDPPSGRPRDRNPMEAAVFAPQQANPAQAAVAQTRMAAMRKLGAASARRKTLCDITNLRRPLEGQQQDGSRCADGVDVDGFARLVKENSDLVKLLEESDKFIESLRLANWQIAQANSQMLAEINLGKDRLKMLQHELTCSRAALKVKSSELEETKKALKSSRHQKQKSANETARHLVADRPAAAAQLKDGDAEPDSDASRATSANKSTCNASANKSTCNASRKRLLRSRSLGPAVAPTKLVAASNERESAQRRKSMRTPQSGGRREDLFEIEDVQFTAGGGDDRKGASWELDSSVQFPRRSSLGRPLRRAAEKVTSYKEMPGNIKLRRP